MFKIIWMSTPVISEKTWKLVVEYFRILPVLVGQPQAIAFSKIIAECSFSF